MKTVSKFDGLVSFSPEQFVQERTRQTWLVVLLGLAFIAAILIAPTIHSKVTLGSQIYNAVPSAPDYYKNWWLLVTGLVMVALWAFSQSLQKKLRLFMTPFHFFLGVIVAFSALSLLWTFHFHLGEMNVRYWLAAWIFGFIAIQVFHTFEDIKLFAWFLVVAGTLASIIGYFQFLGKLDWYLQAAPPSITFGNKNMAMDWLVLVLPFAWVLFYTERKPFILVLLAICIVVQVSLVFHSVNRAGIIGFILEGFVFCIFLIFRLKNKYPLTPSILHTILGIGIVLAIVALITFTQGHFGNTFDALRGRFQDINPDQQISSFMTRVDLYRNTLYMILDHWLLGVGMGSWTIFYPFYAGHYGVNFDNFVSAGYNIIYKQTHNEYLQLVAEIGITGLIAGIMATWHLLMPSFRTILKSKNYDDPKALLSFAVLLACLGEIAPLAFSFPFRVSMPLVTIAILSAMGYHLAILSTVRENGRLSKLPKFLQPTWCMYLSLPSWSGWVIGIMCLGCIFPLSNIAISQTEAHKLRNLGAGFAMGGNADMSVRAIKASLAINPADPDDANFILGNIYIVQQKYDLAIHTFEKTLAEIYPYHMYMWSRLAQAYELKGDLTKQQETLKMAIEKMPLQDGYWSQLGNSYALQGRNEEAIDAYRQSLLLNETSPLAPKLREIIAGHENYMRQLKEQQAAANAATQVTQAATNSAGSAATGSSNATQK